MENTDGIFEKKGKMPSYNIDPGDFMETANGVKLLIATMGFWILQFLTYSELASIATVFSGFAAGVYWLYSLYRKIKSEKNEQDRNS